MKFKIFIIVFVLYAFQVNAQSNYVFGVLPSISISKNFSETWKINFKTESRQVLKSGTLGDNSDFEYNYLLTDFTTIVARSFDENKALGAGYLLRFKESRVIYRTIQQFLIYKNFEKFKLSQRFSTDQTFSENRNPEFRLRYLISAELPLNADTTNSNTFYLKITNEYLNALLQNEYDFEIRVISLLGYKINSKNKIELGLDYRLSKFINSNTHQVFWINTNYILKI